MPAQREAEQPLQDRELGERGHRLPVLGHLRLAVQRRPHEVPDPHALSLPPHVTFGMAEGFSLSLAKQAIHGNLDDVIDTVKNNLLIG